MSHTDSLSPPVAGNGISSMHLYGALAIAGVVAVQLMRHAGLTIDPWSRSNAPYALAACAAVVLRLGGVRWHWRHGRAVGDCAEYYALFTAMALMGAVTSYPIAAMTHGYADAALHRVDAALHFDWLAWYGTVSRHRLLQLAGVAAYESIYLTPAVLLGRYAVFGERDRAHRFLATFGLTATGTLALFGAMPAVGPFSYLWHGPITYMPVSELWQPDLIPALRAHAVRVVDLGQLRGIVSAPSFHAAAATLYIAFAWQTRPLRWPLLWLNLAMLLATPVEGTHYLADMLIGTAVALVALKVVRRIEVGLTPRGAGTERLAAAWS